MTTHRVLTSWTGFCAGCPVEQPLLLVESGPHGLRAWLSGAGPEDRTLSYACAVCGRVEQVPATEEEDAAYDATLVRWPDWVAEPAAVVVDLAVSLPVVDPEPVAPVAAVPAPRPAAVSIITLPRQRVAATDVLAAAA